MITLEQCRAARGLIDWSREQLSEASKVSHRSIVDFERGAREPREITKAALRAAFEAAGIEFLENGQIASGAGVAFKAPDA